MTFKELVLDRTESLATDQAIYQLVLFNDEVNTFDWVIESLMEVCQHTPEQAEQSSIIVHHKGKCRIKSGTWEILEPRCTALQERGLCAIIE